MSSSPSFPVYFEESWAILSSIGIINILFGIAIIRLTSLSPISLVPIIISAASAIANGLCYYAYYTNYPQTNILIAAIFADITWLIQEAGMLFYSYLILTQLLHNRPRLIYISLFWTLITLLSLLRITILTCRAHLILTSSPTTTTTNLQLQPLIAHLHIGYFLALSLTESLSSYFLLRKLSSARRTSLIFTNSSSLFSYLMRSTQLRGGIIVIIGVGRAITWALKGMEGVRAIGVAGQVDRFLYVGECLFPVVMFIDILASKLITTNQSRSRNRSPNCITRNRSRSGPGIRALSPEMCLVTHVERNLEEGSTGSRVEISREEEEEVEVDGCEYVISRDIVDFSSLHSKTTDFEFLVGRVDACL